MFSLLLGPADPRNASGGAHAPPQPYGAEFASWIKRAGEDSAARSARLLGEWAGRWRRRGDADGAAAGLDRLAGQIDDPIHGIAGDIGGLADEDRDARQHRTDRPAFDNG